MRPSHPPNTSAFLPPATQPVTIKRSRPNPVHSFETEIQNGAGIQRHATFSRVTDLLDRVKSNIAERKLIQPGDSILVAVSGVADSMALIHLLHQLAQQLRFPITVAHLNHRLRGRASDADEAFVLKTARGLGLKCVAGQANVREYSIRKKVSVEMAARDLRHGFLARTARRLRLPKIALAHHAGDQLELFFLRLLRGAGNEGAAGMRWTSPSPSDPRVQLVRPLLNVSRHELEGFLAASKIEFREDTTNHRLDADRNRVRHLLLPLIKTQFQPALERVVCRHMEISGAEAEFVLESAQRWRENPAGDFAALHPALQRQVLMLGLIGLGITPDYDLIERLRLNPDTPIQISPALRVSRDRAGTLHKAPSRNTPFAHDQRIVPITGPSGTVAFGGLNIGWDVRTRASPAVPRRAAGREFFDADRVGTPIVLRHWQPGDRFHPIGSNNAVKLQDLFTNLKVPRGERRQRVLATTSKGDIFWVEGLRISERFRLDKTTHSRLKWIWRRD